MEQRGAKESKEEQRIVKDCASGEEHGSKGSGEEQKGTKGSKRQHRIEKRNANT